MVCEHTECTVLLIFTVWTVLSSYIRIFYTTLQNLQTDTIPVSFGKNSRYNISYMIIQVGTGVKPSSLSHCGILLHHHWNVCMHRNLGQVALAMDLPGTTTHELQKWQMCHHWVPHVVEYIEPCLSVLCFFPIDNRRHRWVTISI